MRDAESILDQMISFSEGPINTDDVFYVLGMPAYDIYHKFAGFIAGGDFNGCYRLLDELIRGGMEVIVLVSGLLEYFRNLYVLTVDDGKDKLIDLPGEDVEEMRTLLDSFMLDDVQNILVLLSRLYMDSRNSEIARQLLEVTLIKLVRYRDIIHPSSILQRLEELKGDIGKSRAGSGKPLLQDNADQGYSPGAAEKKRTDENRRENPSEMPLKEQIIQHFSRKRRALTEYLKRAKLYTLEDNLLTISYEADEKYSYDHVHESSILRYLEKEIRSFLQKEIRLNVAIQEEDKKSGKEQNYSEDVSKVMKIFKGEIVPNSTISTRGGSEWE
jgi:DNA polymerase-3 subunit gamma/tau